MAVCHLNIARSCVLCLYCVYIVACSPISNINRHSMPGPCFSSTHYYLPFAYVFMFAALVNVRRPQIVFGHICGNQMGCFNQTTLPPQHTQTRTKQTNTPCWKDGYNCMGLGGRAQCGLDMRPERLISILLPVNSLNLLPSPSRQ